MKIELMLLSVVLLAAFFAAPPRASVSAAGNDPSASGHGNITLADELRTFSFHAMTKKNGTVTGGLTLQSRQQDTFIKASINCLSVVGNTATMSGTITHSSDPDLVGLSAIFRVRDNGEGSNDPSDEMGLLFAPSPLICTNNAVFTLLPIEGGNVQVDN